MLWSCWRIFSWRDRRLFVTWQPFQVFLVEASTFFTRQDFQEHIQKFQLEGTEEMVVRAYFATWNTSFSSSLHFFEDQISLPIFDPGFPMHYFWVLRLCLLANYSLSILIYRRNEGADLFDSRDLCWSKGDWCLMNCDRRHFLCISKKTSWYWRKKNCWRSSYSLCPY